MWLSGQSHPAGSAFDDRYPFKESFCSQQTTCSLCNECMRMKSVKLKPNTSGNREREHEGSFFNVKFMSLERVILLDLLQIVRQTEIQQV